MKELRRDGCDGRRRVVLCTSLVTCELLEASERRSPHFIRSSQASSVRGAVRGEAVGFPWSGTHHGGFQIQKDMDAISRWVPRAARTSALPFRVRQAVIY